MLQPSFGSWCNHIPMLTRRASSWLRVFANLTRDFVKSSLNCLQSWWVRVAVQIYTNRVTQLQLIRFLNHLKEHTMYNFQHSVNWAKMVISSRSYSHLKIRYNQQQLNNDRSSLFSENASCKFIKNDCGVKIELQQSILRGRSHIA